MIKKVERTISDYQLIEPKVFNCKIHLRLQNLIYTRTMPQIRGNLIVSRHKLILISRGIRFSLFFLNELPFVIDLPILDKHKEDFEIKVMSDKSIRILVSDKSEKYIKGSSYLIRSNESIIETLNEYKIL